MLIWMKLGVIFYSGIVLCKICWYIDMVSSRRIDDADWLGIRSTSTEYIYGGNCFVQIGRRI